MCTHLFQRKNLNSQLDDDPEDSTGATDSLEQLLAGIYELALMVHQFRTDYLVGA